MRKHMDAVIVVKHHVGQSYSKRKESFLVEFTLSPEQSLQSCPCVLALCEALFKSILEEEDCDQGTAQEAER